MMSRLLRDQFKRITVRLLADVFSKVRSCQQLDLNLVLRRFVMSTESFIRPKAGWEQSLTIQPLGPLAC